MINELKFELHRERDWIVSLKDIFETDGSNSSSTTQEIMKSNGILYPNILDNFPCLACIAPCLACIAPNYQDLS